MKEGATGAIGKESVGEQTTRKEGETDYRCNKHSPVEDNKW
jgi:hypothetical protein